MNDVTGLYMMKGRMFNTVGRVRRGFLRRNPTTNVGLRDEAANPTYEKVRVRNGT